MRAPGPWVKGALAHAAHGLIRALALSPAMAAWDSCLKQEYPAKVSNMMRMKANSWRTARWRDRRRRGVVLVPVEIGQDAVRALIADGRLSASENGGRLRVTRAQVGAAIAELVLEWADEA